MIDLGRRCSALGVSQYQVEHLAFVAYAAWRAWRISTGDYSPDPWALTESAIKDEWRAEAIACLEMPAATRLDGLLDADRKTAIFCGIVTALDPRR